MIILIIRVANWLFVAISAVVGGLWGSIIGTSEIFGSVGLSATQSTLIGAAVGLLIGILSGSVIWLMLDMRDTLRRIEAQDGLGHVNKKSPRLEPRFADTSEDG